MPEFFCVVRAGQRNGGREPHLSGVGRPLEAPGPETPPRGASQQPIREGCFCGGDASL